MTGTVVAVCVSERSGTRKTPVEQVRLQPRHGIEGDAHARDWHRQVSLLADEDAQSMRDEGADVGPGDFAENILTRGLDLGRLPVGTRLRLGSGALLEITQIGKTCHSDCEILRLVGHCIMPKKGLFARVLEGGTVRPGDALEILPAG